MSKNKYDPEKLDQFFENVNKHIESGPEKKRIEYSVDYPEGWERGDRELVIFEFTPFYDVNRPFRFSGFLLSLAGFRPLQDAELLKNKKAKDTLKEDTKALKTEIQNLIDDIDNIDEHVADHLNERVKEAKNRIEQEQKRYDFYKDMQRFFRTFRNGKPDLNLLFQYDHLSDKDKERTKAAISHYVDKKEPMIDRLTEKVKTLQIYSRAIKLGTGKNSNADKLSIAAEWMDDFMRKITRAELPTDAEIKQLFNEVYPGFKLEFDRNSLKTPKFSKGGKIKKTSISKALLFIYNRKHPKAKEVTWDAIYRRYRNKGYW